MSISDVARIAGVSVSTVSRALTDKGKLNQQTRERIRTIAEEHGYQLHVAAQNLRLGRAGAIGLVLPLGHEKDQHLYDPFFMSMLAYLADNVSQRGYDLILRRVEPEQDDWLETIIASRRMDGLLILGQSDQSEAIERAGLAFDQMVVWGQWRPGQSYLSVGVDNVTGGRLAAEHLLSRGRSRLAFMGNTAVPEFQARYEGFTSMLPPDLHDAHDLVPIHLTANDSYEAAVEFLKKRPGTNGVFAASDVVAMSVIRAAVECGIQVPDDLSVVGFDDVPLAAQSNPPLTTIRQDMQRGSQLMCDLLFARLDGKKASSHRLVPELIVRGSS